MACCCKGTSVALLHALVFSSAKHQKWSASMSCFQLWQNWTLWGKATTSGLTANFRHLNIFSQYAIFKSFWILTFIFFLILILKRKIKEIGNEKSFGWAAFLSFFILHLKNKSFRHMPLFVFCFHRYWTDAFHLFSK